MSHLGGGREGGASGVEGTDGGRCIYIYIYIHICIYIYIYTYISG